MKSDYLTRILVMLVGVFANAFSSILCRQINREAKIKPLIITIISMGFGSFLLLGISFFIQKLPDFNSIYLLLILWLAIINTAFAFTIRNLTLRTLTVAESSIINGIMLFQIVILAWIFLGEVISLREIAGMIIALLGVIFVQIKFKKNFSKTGNSVDK